MSSSATQALTHRGVPLDANLRILALSQFAHRFAGGALLSTSALYYTRHQGLSAAEVGVALSFAGLVGLMVAVPAGQVADARGATRTLVWFTAGAAITAWPPAFATNAAALTALLALQAVFLAGTGSVQQGVVARLATGGRGVGFKAYLRAVTNIGLALGSFAGGLALLVDQAWAFVAVFFAQAALTGFAAWNLTRLPALPVYRRAAGEPRLPVLRDHPYAVLMALHMVMTIHFFVIEVGLVLFIATHTSAPIALVSATLILNTVLVAALQVRLTRGIDTVSAGSRSLRHAGWLIGSGFVLIGFAQGVDPVMACALLLVGTTLHAVGEMLGSGGQWSHQMGLAPSERQGQYQGFASLSVGAASVVGPSVATFACVSWGRGGWLVLAAVMVTVTYAMGPVAQWALASRDRYGVHTHSG